MAATVGSLSLLADPATAQQLTVHDPAGDAVDHGLDLTRITVRNLDHKVVAKVHFVESVRGNLIISLDPRHATGLRMVSEYRPTGHTRNLVVPGAFTDKHGGEQPAPTRCKGFTVAWSAARPMATLSMPSRCLHRGNFGALRFAALTEKGPDSDYAPGESGSSAWIPRG